MRVKTYIDRSTLSTAAAQQAAQALRAAIRARGTARIVAATGASQFDFLETLTHANPRIEPSRNDVAQAIVDDDVEHDVGASAMKARQHR